MKHATQPATRPAQFLLLSKYRAKLAWYEVCLSKYHTKPNVYRVYTNVYTLTRKVKPLGIIWVRLFFIYK